MKIIPVSAEFIVKRKVPFKLTSKDCRLIWSNPAILDFLPEWALADFERSQNFQSTDFLESLLPLLMAPPSLRTLSRAFAHMESVGRKVEVDFSSPSNWTFYYRGFSGTGESPAAALEKRSKESQQVESLIGSVGLGLRIDPIPDDFEKIASSLNPWDILSTRVKNLLEIAEKLPHVFGSQDDRNA